MNSTTVFEGIITIENAILDIYTITIWTNVKGTTYIIYFSPGKFRIIEQEIEEIVRIRRMIVVPVPISSIKHFIILEETIVHINNTVRFDIDSSTKIGFKLAVIDLDGVAISGIQSTTNRV